jgi:hypothetical protein
MKIPFLLLCFLVFLTMACGSTPVVIVVTATPQPPSYPTQAIPPTQGPQPAHPAVTLFDIENALMNDGYARKPYVDNSGTNAYAWTKDNPYEQVYTWDTGEVRLEVLNRPNSRMSHMEQKLALLDTIFPSDFMAQLRQENQAYNASLGVSASVSGTPDVFYEPSSGATWNEKDGRYNVSQATIGPYSVTFAMWFYQVTCPSQYSYCYYSDFPGQEFTGDSSLVFYSIDIVLPKSSAPSG